MELIDTYMRGETKKVYDEIYSLSDEAFTPKNFIQTDLVLKEIFKRVKINLQIIYRELQKINYSFISNIIYEWEHPLLPPPANTDFLLSVLKFKVMEVGKIPLSLEYFYKIVGSCNFGWDWELHPDIPWEGSDPIVIPPLNSLLEMVDENSKINEILITGDYLQKDNISGSCCYIKLTTELSFDSLFTGYNIPFIEYLQSTLFNCGFTRANLLENESLILFCNKTRPMLIEF